MQLDGLDWDVHILDSARWEAPHPGLREVTVHVAENVPVDGVHQSVRVRHYPTDDGDWASSCARELARLVRELRPDIVHSQELQHAGYLTLEARQLLGGAFPPWLVTSWGSDLDLFGRQPSERGRIGAVMRACDYFGAECHRDVAQARTFGFRGKVIGVWPVAGGVSLERWRRHRTSGPSSQRRAIAVKGQCGRFGRGQVAVEAIELCGRRLQDFELCIWGGEPTLNERWRRLSARLGTKLTLAGETDEADGRFASHELVLGMHGRSRASINLGISGGLCTSMLEAAAMGSLPIQSVEGCSPELLPAGTGAIYVSAEDPEEVAAAVISALNEPRLVDRIAAANESLVERHLNSAVIGARVIDAYERILGDRATSAEAA
jgi:glycosyltransferase involved in cell wall biosynthesis